MDSYRITGGFPISGSVTVSGNKNAALPCIAATLLTDEKVILRNIPMINDVKAMGDILKKIGVDSRLLQPGVVEIQARSVTSEISADLAKAMRASILFAGPILARTGKVVLPPPGGDVIGRRRVDTHFLAFKELGAQIHIDGKYELKANKLIGNDIFLDEASVTATENTIMAAVLAEGETVIRNAAGEPHVQDLCNMLVSMGARISGIGSNILFITGVPSLHGTDFTIGPDFMEVGSWIGLAAVTHGTLRICNAGVRHLRMIRLNFSRLGIHWEEENDDILLSATQPLKVVSDLGGMIPKIDDAPWPGFPADLTSIMIVVATQAEGTVLVHEKLFESRMFFVDKLIEMGARIVLCDPHRAVISGPARLRGSVLTSPDVRAGMAMVLAALCADGESIIHNVYQIERGYENLVDKLQSLGAHITRMES